MHHLHGTGQWPFVVAEARLSLEQNVRFHMAHTGSFGRPVSVASALDGKKDCADAVKGTT